MNKYLVKLEEAFASKDFPLWVLSAAGILCMPAALSGAVLILLCSSLAYRFLKQNPGSLKDKNLLSRPELQRFAVILFSLFWFFAFRSGLLEFFWTSSSPGFIGFASLFIMPLLSYLTAVWHSYASWPANAANKSKPEQELRLEQWTHSSFAGFMAAFVCSALAIAWFPEGVGSWLANWLLACGRDANLGPTMNTFTSWLVDVFSKPDGGIRLIYHQPPSYQFHLIVKSILAAVLLASFWSPARRFAAFLCSAVRKSNGKSSKLAGSFMLATQNAETAIELKETGSFKKNLLRSFSWLASCYLLLFGLIGFAGGPLGDSIQGWLDRCIYEAEFGKPPAVANQQVHDDRAKEQADSKNKNSKSNNGKKARSKLATVHWPRLAGPRSKSDLYLSTIEKEVWMLQHGTKANPNLRIFCAAIFALYGTVPLAVTGAVFLPLRRRRKIILDEDTVFFADGEAGSGIKPLRLWTELRSLDYKEKKAAQKAGSLIFEFKDKKQFKLKLSRLSKTDLRKLLAAVDQRSPCCVVSESAASLIQSSQEAEILLGNFSAEAQEQFESTVFETHAPGSCLPDGETRVVKILASRPLSCVYLVRNSAGNLAIAKQFYFAEQDDASREMRKCFQREYETLAKLDHESIARVLDVFEKDESTYLLLEHSSGTELRTLVAKQGARLESEVIDWALQICDIMIYLHEQNPAILHRDLSPDNLILTPDGQIRIIDFGAAQRYMEGLTGTVIGKQSYVAPEQLQGHACVQSDIYSFGAVLFYLLSAEDPLALSKSDASSKADLTDELKNLILNCTEFDQSKRPRSFSELKEALITARDLPASVLMSRFQKLAESQSISASASHNSENGKEAQQIKQANKPADASIKNESPTQTAADIETPTVVKLSKEEEIKVE